MRFFSVSNRFTYIINQNVTHKTAGNKEGDNAVLPAWRDSLYITKFGVTGDPLASFAEVEAQPALVNEWQIALHDITPGGGSYMNEATFNFPYWKDDYYGEYYDDLVTIKSKYDPAHILWANPSPGSDAYELLEDGHLCKT